MFVASATKIINLVMINYDTFDGRKSSEERQHEEPSIRLSLAQLFRLLQASSQDDIQSHRQ
jgi:hypothetical protein